MLHFDDKRYMFGNIHEGYQRACVQNGIKLPRLNDLFLTGRTEWKNTGGILGMMLTIADMANSAMESALDSMKQAEARFEERKKQARTEEALAKIIREWKPAQLEKPSITLHGGANLMQTVATARRFIFRQGMPIHVNEYMRSGDLNGNSKPTWADHNIRVWPMSIEPSEIVERDDSGDDITTSATTPRKRNFDDYLAEKSTAGGSDSSGTYELNEYGQRRLGTLKKIVSDMFDSDWQRDALFETPLAEVHLPATLFVRNAETHRIEKYEGPMPGNGQAVPNVKVLVRKPWPAAVIGELPETTPSHIAMSYIIKTHPQRGKFNKKAAQDLGIPPGPLYSQLANGSPVQNKNGETIYPDQVMDKTKPGKGFAVIELPSTAYISSLLARPEWRNADASDNLGVIVWNLGLGVADDEKLQNFIIENKHMKHIISSPDYCANYLTMDSSSAATIRHNRLDSERFGLPLHSNLAKALPAPLSHCTIANRGLSVQLEPDIIVEAQKTPGYLNTTLALQQLPKETLALAQTAHTEILSRKVQNEVEKQDLPSPEAEIITLGTGSAIPSKYRNVSGTLIRVPGSGSYLLDCGEGTLGQLSRIFSPSELQEVLKDLRLIWISHMHCDHHLGLVSVVKAWRTAVYGDPREVKLPGVALKEQSLYPVKYMTEQQRLFIASEPTMMQWLREYADIEDYGYDRLVPVNVRSFLSNLTTHLSWNKTEIGFNTNSPKINRAMKSATGLTNLEAVAVKHCSGANAVVLTFPTGFKVSYSGDCRPSKNFAKIGKGSTVLIHEATFDDELGGEAYAKNHSTTSEAIGVGLEMGARRIILTHFSQRYQKISKADSFDTLEVKFEESNAPDDFKTTRNAENVSSVDIMDVPNVPIDPTVPNTAIQSVGNMEDKADTSPKKVIIKSNTGAKYLKVGAAFDLMRVKVKDIMLLEKFAPVFTKLYDQHPLSKDINAVPPSPVTTDTAQDASRKQSKAEKKKAKATTIEEKRKIWEAGRTVEAETTAKAERDVTPQPPPVPPTQDAPLPDAGGSGRDNASDPGAESDASSGSGSGSPSKRHLKKLARAEERKGRRKAEKEHRRRSSSGAMSIDK